MKELILTICLLALIVMNLFSQGNTIKVDSGYANEDGSILFYLNVFDFDNQKFVFETDL